ncbi:MAG: hypothetical protein JNN27_13480 [Planctomycetes bacterium]|nr:hypothetical protein [Planctomycetota bacterium]
MRGRSRFTALVALVLATAVATYWFAGERTHDAPAIPTADAAAAAERADAPVSPLPAAWALDDEAERGEVTSTVAAPAVEPLAAAQSKVTLRGRVVVTQRDGTERADLDGKFSLYARSGVNTRWEPIRFQRGEWTALTTLDQASDGIRVDRMYADGIGAFVDGTAAVVDDPAKWVHASSSGELTVRAHVPPAVVLRVVDAATAADIRGVSLVRSEWRLREDAQHPGLEFDKRIIATGLTSPIDVSTYSVAADLWSASSVLVGAPGYAWSIVRVDLARGGEHSVALKHGAALTVLVRGVDPGVSEKLRLRTGDDPHPILELPLTADGAIELDGLGVGELRVAAEIGEVFENPLELAETSTALRPGERASVTLDLAPAPKFETATASGLIFVAKAWARESLDVELDLLDTLLRETASWGRPRVERVTSDRAGYDAFRWTRGDLQVGRYELEVDEPRFKVGIEVPAGGRDDFEFVLGAPVELLVRVVDAATGAPASIACVAWAPRKAPGSRGNSLEYAPFDATRGGYIIRSVPEVVSVWVEPIEHMPHDEDVDLARGTREHVVVLQRAARIEAAARSGDTRLVIPDEWDWEESPSEIDGGGETCLRVYPDDSSRIFILSKPGVYQLNPPRIPGYRELPLQRIEVFAGRKTEHVLEYEPERP